MVARQLKLWPLDKIFRLPRHFMKSCSFYHGVHMFDQIPKPPLLPVHRSMLDLIRDNRQKEAIDTFRRHIPMGVDEVVIAIASKACLGRIELGSQIHSFAVVSGFMDCVSVCNSLMNLYCKSRDVRRASLIFESMENPDTVSYNTMLSGFEESKKAIFFARGMHSGGIGFDAVTYTAVLAHCADAQELEFGFQLHCLVLKFGLLTETFIGNALVTLYSKCGKIIDAEKLFGEIQHKDLVSWNAILSGYAQEGSYGLDAILVFTEMVKAGMQLDHVSFTSVISASSNERNLDVGMQVQGLVLKRGYGTHVSVCNVLMSMYAKYDRIGDAVLVFENISRPNVVSWTTMLSTNEEDAVSLFQEMVRLEISPNDVTFVALIHAITKHGMMSEGLMVHGFCLKSNFLSEVNVANSFITMYGKFEMMEDSIKVFEKIECREIVSCNALISAYSLNGMYQEALHAFSLAARELTPNPYTFGSVLHAIASSESISVWQGQRCHGYLRKLGLNINPVVSGALLDMYAKRGSIYESQKIFDELIQKTQVAWTAIISAHSKHGDYASAIKCFKEMVNEGVKPDSVTFLSILTSCGHNGMIDMGIEIFNSMVKVHFVEPSREHYSCIVDMLGRSGRLKEAEEFLNSIPGGPGISVLQSLLGACRIYGDVGMAVRISDTLIAMEPDESGSYILMSNLFAEKGKWEKVAKMRTLMRDRKVTKEIGFSWADVNNAGDSMTLHGFSSGDKTHPLSGEIYMMAELLGSEMKRRRATTL